MMPVPPGNWHLLAHGNAYSSGSHGHGDEDEVAAEDSSQLSWEHYAYWSAFPGKKGDGSDCEPQVREKIEEIYRGHRCAHVMKNGCSSSFHEDDTDFALVIDLSHEALELLAELGVHTVVFSGIKQTFQRTPPNQVDDFSEFMYPGWEKLMAITRERGELDHTEMPGPKHYAKPQPGETRSGYWQRQITRASASGWIKKLDGD